MVCQYRLMDGNKCATVVQEGDGGGGCACEGSGYTWEHYVLSAQFCYEHKTALKSKVLTQKPRLFTEFLSTT